MKIDRLIGILSVLLQKEKTTAPELAERFEVSRRYSNKDIARYRRRNQYNGWLPDGPDDPDI